MDLLSLLIKIGSLSGIIALIWKIIEEARKHQKELRKYLLIKVEARKVGGDYSIYTQVQNTNKLSKKIDNAFLIISPEERKIIDVGKRIAKELKADSQSIETITDFYIFKSDESKYIDDEIAFIPIAFYYAKEENIQIGDEQLTYTCFVKHKLRKGQYSVRFFLFNENRYPRSTQDLLIIT